MKNRRQNSHDIRTAAADLAFGRGYVQQHSNEDEAKYRRSEITSPIGSRLNGAPSYAANFTKCMPHDPKTGLLINPHDYEDWVKASDSGDVDDFSNLRIGPAAATNLDMANGTYLLQSVVDPVHPHTPPTIQWTGAHASQANAPVRGWEAQGAGLTYDLEGPDAQAVSMPPARAFASQELISEMAELYWMAYLRDVPFHDFGTTPAIDQARQSMSHFYWFIEHNKLTASQKSTFTETDILTTSQSRRRVLTDKIGNDIPLQKLFRGIAPGDEVGPYLSQFLLIGSKDIQPKIMPPAHKVEEGFGAYGAIRFDQRVRIATPNKNYMTNWEDWLDVQNGANVRLTETYNAGWRFIATPRDLCTWVHYDALYEAYLNACLLLLGMGCPFDPGIPFQDQDFRDKQSGFVNFSGPHILTLLTEVATRALKAVRYQKFNVHRRIRPEAVAGELHQWNKESVLEYAGLESMLAAFTGGSGLKTYIDTQQTTPTDAWSPQTELLLPMAFAEGSPPHTSYGSGHATVAGACVTILKAFFDSGWQLPLRDASNNPVAYVPSSNGSVLIEKVLEKPLIVADELNKIASNIAVARHWSGVHYFSDGYESLRLGEKIALGILEEQKLVYGENFSMSIPLFDGTTMRI